jgi:multidrug transporter EmrE-like cation transporter
MSGFSLIPIYFGTAMAVVDLVMMGTVKMVTQGTLSRGVGLPFAVGVYALQPILFWNAASFQGIVASNLIWNMISNILVTVQGIFIFGETFSGLRWVGIGMSLLALTILSLTDN